MEINKDFLGKLFEQAVKNPRFFRNPVGTRIVLLWSCGLF